MHVASFVETCNGVDGKAGHGRGHGHGHEQKTDNVSRACMRMHIVGQTVPSCEIDMWRRSGYDNVNP